MPSHPDKPRAPRDRSRRYAISGSSRLLAPVLTAVVVLLTAVIIHGLASSTSSNTGGTPSGQPAGAPGFSAVMAHGHLFQTVDSGTHWVQVSQAALASSTEPVLYALSPAMRWMAVSQSGATAPSIIIARTSDGGQTWNNSTPLPVDSSIAQPLSMQFVDTSHGWLVVDQTLGHLRQATLLLTKDGGITWTSSALPFSGTISFISTSTGWLVGSKQATLQNLIAITHDGGATWQQQTLPAPLVAQGEQPFIGAPVFFDALNGVLPVNRGQATQLYATHDGGATWVSSFSVPSTAGDEMTVPMVAATGSSAWTIIGHSLLVTRNAGATWTALPHSANLIGVTAFGFVSDTTGWALTQNGVCKGFKSNCGIVSSLVRTMDGGRTWIPVPVAGLG